MIELAGVVIALNEEEHITDCVQSLLWTDKVVVVDTGSTDHTRELAREAGAEVIERIFDNFSQVRNEAMDAVQARWIFFVDADERATPELEQEVRMVIAEKDKVGWWVPRNNYIFGKLTRGGGWSPDYQMRLLLREKARYERPVHEVVALDGEEGNLQSRLTHLNYTSVAQFHAKQRQYSSLAASALIKDQVKIKSRTPFTQFIKHFIWRYLQLGGYKDGVHGLRLCLLSAYYQGLTYYLARVQSST